MRRGVGYGVMYTGNSNGRNAFPEIVPRKDGGAARRTCFQRPMVVCDIRRQPSTIYCQAMFTLLTRRSTSPPRYEMQCTSHRLAPIHTASCSLCVTL